MVLDDRNDMLIAMCDMRIMEQIDPAYLEAHEDILDGAELIVMDPSLTEDSLEYLVSRYGRKIFVDPVSDIYAGKIRPYAGRIFAMKPNRSELSVLSGIKVEDEASLEEAAKHLIADGLQQVYVSLGREGCFYMDKERMLKHSLFAEETMVNASGAGDSFFAGMICGHMRNLPLTETLDLALAAGILAVRSPSAVSEDLSLDGLKQIIEEARHEH